MGNNNVIAGIKEEDNTKTEDQQIHNIEEMNGIDLKEGNRITLEHEVKGLQEQLKESSTEYNCGSEDPREEKLPLKLTEDIEAQTKVSEENGESPSEKIQELVEIAAVTNLSDEVEMLGNKILEMLETRLEKDENKDIEAQTEISGGNSESPSKKIQELVETEAMKTMSDDEEILGDKKLEMIETILKIEEDKCLETQTKIPEENGESWFEEIQELMETEAVKNLSNCVELLGDKNLEMIETILENENNKDVEAQTEVSEEIGESWPDKIQELMETQVVEKMSDDVEILVDKNLEKIEIILGKKENRDDLLQDGTDEKQENRENLIHDTDLDVIESILQNEANTNYSLPIEFATKTENMSTSSESEYIDVGERERHIKDNNNSEMIKADDDLEEVSTNTPKIETIATDYPAMVEEKREIEKEITIPDFKSSSNSVPSSPQLNNQNKQHNLENGSNLSINSEDAARNELVSLKTPDYDFLETETISGRLSTGSIQEKPIRNPELKKSPSFVFDLPLESKLEESDQTPLLYHNKAISRSISSPSSQPISVEEKTNKVERSDSDEIKGPSSDILKEVGSGTFLKRDCQTSFEQNALTKGSEKRKPRPSMFTICICCATAIS